ncbi:hypothetical protein ANN_10961 [Periplaneta americana]|uniref:Uncharacterized protein n=1 Tax=Periplaneta americana TaxID=6978 RepID=A0ABQ8T4X1_PERAM|nr:hypothetical protein ANN_10961 [Periplaneta americana]
MSPGSNTESYPAFAHIGLRENPGKNLPRPGIEPGPPDFAARPLIVTPQENVKKPIRRDRRRDQTPNLTSLQDLFGIPNRRCDEQETLPHFLGFCHHGELLRINRHNTVRSLIASSIRQNASYEVYEEVGCVSSDGSTRCADIIIDRQKDKGVILDPTIRFEMHEQQPQETARMANEMDVRVYSNFSISLWSDLEPRTQAVGVDLCGQILSLVRRRSGVESLLFEKSTVTFVVDKGARFGSDPSYDCSIMEFE